MIRQCVQNVGIKESLVSLLVLIKISSYVDDRFKYFHYKYVDFPFYIIKGNEAELLFFRSTIIKMLLHFLLQIINCNACNQINGLPPTRFVLEILITSEQSHNFPDGFNGINKARMYPYIIYVTIFQIMSRYLI